jgi:pimeloyl-ACP methyl ester carboxylesterase
MERKDTLGMDGTVRLTRIPVNGIHLHVAETGPLDGHPVFLLHGFPEFWYGWRNQIGALAERGFHLIAPDQRGYNLSDKPKGIAAYDLDQLAADVVGLADHFGQRTFDVVGHDWGASAGWWLAGQHPERVRKLVVMNAPHPAVWLEAMHNHPGQRRKSSYVRLFQIPYLPEFLIGINRSKALSKGFQDCLRPGAFTKADLERYRAAWSQPGALTAMINYYRAVLRKRPTPAAQPIACPTLVIWGKRDAYAIPELAELSVRMCADGRIAWFENATHWVQHDEPERVLGILLEFLGT